MSGAAAYVAGAEWRTRWRSAVALAIAAGVATAVVLGAATAARRGPDALDRFVDAYHPADATVVVFGESPFSFADVLEVAASDDDVAGAYAGGYAAAAAVEPDGRLDPTATGGPIRLGGSDAIEAPWVLEGRMPDPAAPFEVAVNEAVVRRTGLEPGDHLDIAVFAADQIDAAWNEQGTAPAHGTHEFTVVGVVRVPSDLHFQNDAQPGTVYEREGEEVYWSPGLYEHFDGDLANYGAAIYVDVRDGADAEEVIQRIAAPFADSGFGETGSDTETDLVAVRQGIDQQSNGVRAFALVVGVTSAVLLVQAFRRQIRTGLLAHQALGAIGMSSGGRMRARILWAVPATVVALVIAVAGSVALSGVGPVGLARQAEISPGIRIDAGVLVIGVLGLAGLLLLTAAVPVRRLEPTAPRRPSALAGLAPTPATAAGSSLAGGLAVRGNGVRASLAALPIAVGAVAAAVVFGSSLYWATTQPDAYGWTWDLAVGNCSEAQCAERAAERLAANPDVSSWTGLGFVIGEVDGVDDRLEVNIVEPGLGWAAGAIVAGRPPSGPHDAVLGAATAAEAGVGPGDTVSIGVEGGTPVPFTVTGIFRPPASLLDWQAQDAGVAVTKEGGQRGIPEELQDLFAEEVVSNYFLIDLVSDVSVADAEARLRADFGGTVLHPYRPAALEAAYRIRELPLLLAGLLAALGVGALLHLSAVGVRRRASTLATLAALGFSRRQRRGVVLTEVALVVLGGVVIGLPLGIAVGRLGWDFAAEGLGSAAAPRTPAAAVVLLVVVSGGLSLLVGSVFGAVSARKVPAAGLRTTG